MYVGPVKVVFMAGTHLIKTEDFYQSKFSLRLSYFLPIKKDNMKYRRSVESIKTPLCEAKLNKTDLPRHSYSFVLSCLNSTEAPTTWRAMCF